LINLTPNNCGRMQASGDRGHCVRVVCARL
jgi:hypothetical protein